MSSSPHNAQGIVDRLRTTFGQGITDVVIRERAEGVQKIPSTNIWIQLNVELLARHWNAHSVAAIAARPARVGVLVLGSTEQHGRHLPLDVDTRITAATSVPAGAFTLPDVAGVGVVPGLAAGNKCARCWQVLEEVGKSASHPLICVRCEEAVA